MVEPKNPPGPPGGDAAARELARALEKASETSRDPDAHDIAADDAGASNLAEKPGVSDR